MNLSIDRVGMTYPTGRRALHDLSLELSSPSLVGLVGPNGAGKTTLMKLLVAGLLPTEGRIAMDGEPLIAQEQRLKARLGYLPQSFGLYDELTCAQFLDYMAALKGIKNSRSEIDRVIAETNLQDKRRARIGTLSGGQRQRVGIAQALLGDPDLLIFDEPTVGLDPEERIHFRNLFSRSAQGKIVVLSTHIIEDVQAICGRLIVLHQGRLRFDGSPAALIRAAQGHVGIWEQEDGDFTRATAQGLIITTRQNTARGVACRVMGQHLPDFVAPVEPSLEDAYMYLIEGTVDAA